VPAGSLALSTYFEHYTQGDFAPYMSFHSVIGAMPVALLEAIQPAGDFSDPAVGDLVILQDRSSGSRGDIDVGGGRFRYHMQPGNLHVVPPNFATSIVIHDPHALRVIAVPGSFASACLADANGVADTLDFGRLHRGGAASPLASQLVSRLWQYAKDPGHSRMLVDALVVALLGELRASGTRALPVRGGLGGAATKRVTGYIAAHLADDVTLGELAAIVGLSPYHFCREFKRATGLPPHRYQITLRVGRAKELLANTMMPIGDVAAAVGYGDQSQLARLFQREIGVSPTKYRRERRR